MKFYQVFIWASCVWIVKKMRCYYTWFIKSNLIQIAILPNYQYLQFSINKKHLVLILSENKPKIPNSRDCIVFCAATPLSIANLLTKPSHYETSLF